MKNYLLIFLFISISAFSSEIKYIKPSYPITRVEHLIFQNGKLFCEGYNGTSPTENNDYIYNYYDGNKFTSLTLESSGFPRKLNNHFIQSIPFVITKSNVIYSIFDNSILYFKNNKWSMFFQDSLKNDTLLVFQSIHKDVFENIWITQLKKTIGTIDQFGNPIYIVQGGRLLKIFNDKIETIIDTNYNWKQNPDYLIGWNDFLTSDSKGNLILANSINLGIYNPIYKTYVNYQLLAYNSDATNSKQTNGIFVDKQDSIWVIFKNNQNSKGGLSKFKDGNWYFITKNDGYDYFNYTSYLSRPNFIYYSKDSCIWIGSSNGCIRVKNKKIEVIDPQKYHNIQYETSVTSIAESMNGEIYLGVAGGILVYKDNGTLVDDIETDVSIKNMFNTTEELKLKFRKELINFKSFRVFDLVGNEIKISYSQESNSIFIQNSLNTGLYNYSLEIDNNLFNGRILIYEK